MRSASKSIVWIVLGARTVWVACVTLSVHGEFLKSPHRNPIRFKETDMTTASKTRIALVTGGSRGLGRSTVLNLAAQSVDVILTYKSNEAEAQAAVREVEVLGRRAVALPLDVGDSKSFAAFAERVKRVLASTWQRDRFDHLVNNAGVGAHAAFADTTEAQFDLLMNVHLKGTFFLTQALLPLIADGGRIVNTSSGLARFTFAGYSAYAAMKGGVEVLTRYLAKELAPRGIAVNTVAPGAIETDFGGGAVRDNAQLNAQVAGVTALGRVGLPEDIGGAVAALLSEGTRWMTGQRIEVSGGMML
jgi:NAD(P)-dependent dehydrogenase (short-subunit alcohol dehydrogenase family)